MTYFPDCTEGKRRRCPVSHRKCTSLFLGGFPPPTTVQLYGYKKLQINKADLGYRVMYVSIMLGKMQQKGKKRIERGIELSGPEM